MGTSNGHRSGHRSQTILMYRLQLALDLIYLASALMLAGLMWFRHLVPLSPLAAVAIFGPVFLWAGLLYRRASGPYISLVRFPVVVWVVVKAVALGALLAIGSFAAAGELLTGVGPWLAAVLNGLILALELPYLYVYRRSVGDGRSRARNLLVVGSGDRVADFVKHVARSRLPVQVSGIVGRNPKRVGKSVLGVPVMGLIDDLPQILKRVQVDEVVFLLSRAWLDLVEKPMLLCERAGVRVLLSTDVYPFRLSSPRIEEMGDFQLLAFEPSDHSELALSVKAVMDFALAGILLVATLPLWGLIALGIRLTSPGPVFFKQERCGLQGRKFVMWKFRTMVPNAEELKGDLQSLNEMTGPVFKIKCDPRVTTLGCFLRRSSLDELPQLINVLRGEMSLVGPRPLPVAEAQQCDIWQRRRLSVKPGMTCIWQTSGRNKVGFEEWVRMDMEYIENWSLRLDLKLLVKTVPAVLLGTGA